MQATCARPGCFRTVKNSDQHRECSAMCKYILGQLEGADRLCAALGSDGLPGQYREGVAEMSAAWSRVQDVDYRLFKEAMSVGIPESDWTALKTGVAGSSRRRRRKRSSGASGPVSVS